MIQNQQQLNRTCEAIAKLEESLALLKLDQASIHPKRFALMAEPIIEDIRRLRGEIGDYIGLIDAVRSMAQAEAETTYRVANGSDRIIPSRQRSP
jgi:hypothetical protein